MVLMLTINKWPANKSAEIGKAYLEVMKKFPDDKSIEKPVLRGAIWTDNEGTRSISVSSIKKGKVKESMDLAMKRLLMMSESLEGFKYEVHIAHDLVEAMPLIGLAAPE